MRISKLQTAHYSTYSHSAQQLASSFPSSSPTQQLTQGSSIMVFNAYVSLTGAVGAGSKLDTAHQTISELEVQITRTKPTIEKLRKEIDELRSTPCSNCGV